MAATSLALGSALQFLSKEACLHATSAVIAVCRARDAFSAGGQMRQRAWHLSGGRRAQVMHSIASPAWRRLGYVPYAFSFMGGLPDLTPHLLLPYAAPLEFALARSMSCPETTPGTIATAGLRMADSDRVAIHNELSRVQVRGMWRRDASPSYRLHLGKPTC